MAARPARRAGERLSTVTARLAEAYGVEARLLPATDGRLRTWIDTAAGSFPFQEWFVGRGHRDDVDGVRFEGSDAAAPAPGTLEALAGLRPRLVMDAEKLPGSRVLEGRFTAIQQAIGTPKGRDAGARYLREFVEDVKASGLVARVIEGNGVRGVSVAPEAPSR